MATAFLVGFQNNSILRFCVAYRKLIAVMVENSYTIPRVDKCISSLRTVILFLTLEANSNIFRRLKIDGNNMRNTLFVTHEASYTYAYMLFGLKKPLPRFNEQ